MLGVATVHTKQYGVYRLSAKLIADIQANISTNSKPNSRRLQITSKGLGRSAFVKENQRSKNLVELSL
jgi:hypothetical protein